MKTNFTDSITPTVYCSQRASPDLSLFDCLLIYPSGVPNKKFNVDFSYDYQGSSGYLRVPVDPLSGQNSRTSNRASSRVNI
jgi:hypothetical protein